MKRLFIRMYDGKRIFRRSENPHFIKYSVIIICFSVILITFSETGSLAQAWKSYPSVKPGSKVEFPRDEGLHQEEPLEWWYANGHLTGQTTGHQYSFMLAYFHKPISDFDGFRILTITDETTHVSSSQVLPCTYPVLSADSLHIQAAFLSGEPPEIWVNQTDSTGSMMPFQYLIKASTGEDSICLNLDATRPPLILDEDGFLYQGSGNYTYYYSLTNLAVGGSVTFEGIQENVTGIAWFDRQYGSFNPYEDESYEWFSIQLEGNMDLNIWNIFTPENSIPSSKEYRICSVIKSDTVSFTTSSFQIERLSFAMTPDSQRYYATSWRIISDTLDMDLVVEVNDEKSEIHVSQIKLRFFEGSTKVTGKINNSEVSGVGFAELSHAYENPVILISQPDAGDRWNHENPLVWQLNNPDDGNPLKFDVDIEYLSTASVKIAAGLDDTLFYWNPSVFAGDSVFRFNVTAFSSDSTLKGFATGEFLLEPLNTELNACIDGNVHLDLNLDSLNLQFKWFYNGQATGFPEISTLDIYPVTIEAEGTYKCLVYNEFFRDTTLEFYLHAEYCNHTTNHLIDNTIVFPNPFTEFLTVHLPCEAGNCLIQIKNLQGLVVYETIINQMEEEIIYPCLLPGMYLVEIISRKNSRTWYFKIVRRE